MPARTLNSLLVLVFVGVGVQGSVKEAICNGPLDLVHDACATSVNVPTGAEVIFKQQCTNVPCTGCSKQHCGESCINIPCTGCSKQHCGETCIFESVPCSGCSKQHCGETCIWGACTHNCCTWECGQDACTHNCCEWDCGNNQCTNNCCEWDCGQSECIDIPDTLKLKTSNMGVCELLEDLVPLLAQRDEILEAIGVACSCMDEALDYIQEDLLDTADSDSFTEATAEALKVAGDLVDCFAESSSSVSSEKDAILAEVTAKDGVEIFAPEIGIGLYSSFVGAIVACAVGGKCEDIILVLENLLTDTLSEVGSGLVTELRRHYTNLVFTPFQELYGSFTDRKNAAYKEADALFDEVQACIAQGVAKVRDLQTAYENAVSEVKAKAELVEGVAQDVNRTALAIEGAIQAVEDLVDALDRSWLQQVVDAIETGEKPSIATAVEFFVSNEHVQTIRSSASNIHDFVVNLEDHLSDLLEAFEALEASVNALFQLPECAFSPSVDPMGAISHVEDVTDRFFQQMRSLLEGDGLGVRFEAGFASYSSFLDVRIDNLPCSRLREQEFTNALCPLCSPIKADVPEFYACSWEEQIPLPKEHTPYLRLVFDDAGGTTSSGAQAAEPASSACGPGERLFQLDLWTDRFGLETSWNVEDCGGTEEASSGVVVYENKKLYTETRCLQDGVAHKFTIIDEEHDGICCKFGTGNYTVSYGGTKVQSGGEFGASDVVLFGGSCEVGDRRGELFD